MKQFLIIRFGHGTHVSGIIGAVNNTFGVVGVAPEATIVSVKVLDSTGKSQDDSVAQGLKYCLSLAPDIINLSIGNANPMPDAYEYIKQLHKNGVILVAAAGNTGTEGVAYPAAYDEVIAVGSFSNSMVKDKSLFSSYGKELDLMAPGEEILSTYLNNQYSVLSGTSMASPFVSGVIALLLSYYKSKNKQISPDEVRKILLESCADAKEKGFDKQTGWGIVDPSKLFNNLPEGLAIKKPSFWQKLRNLFK